MELAEAERLCQELSAIVAEPYLKEELTKRLESISNPLKSLEERAGHWSSFLFCPFFISVENYNTVIGEKSESHTLCGS